MTTADTKRWRKLLKNGNPCRDSSPLPESVAAPYKKPRAPDERKAACAKLKDWQLVQHPDRVPRDNPIRKTRTDVELNAEQINKVFFERDILKDKLRRRNDEIDDKDYEIDLMNEWLRIKNAKIRRKDDEIDRKDDKIEQLEETIRRLKDE